MGKFVSAEEFLENMDAGGGQHIPSSIEDPEGKMSSIVQLLDASQQICLSEVLQADRSRGTTVQ